VGNEQLLACVHLILKVSGVLDVKKSPRISKLLLLHRVRLTSLCQSPVYLPAGTWFDFWTKEAIVSRGERRVFDASSLEKMPIWLRVISWAAKRLRTFNIVGRAEKVELYGEREGPWSCGDGEGGTIEVVEGEDWKCVCKGRENVDNVTFGLGRTQ
jgi:hypothetical protein